MPTKYEHTPNPNELRLQLEQQHHDLDHFQGWIFGGMVFYIDSLIENAQMTETTALRIQLANNTARFAGAQIASDLEDERITHLIVGDNRDKLRGLRRSISSWVMFVPSMDNKADKGTDGLAYQDS